MKKSIASVLTVAALAALFGGCNYEAPFVDGGAATPVDEALLGLWHAVPAEGGEQAAPSEPDHEQSFPADPDSAPSHFSDESIPF